MMPPFISNGRYVFVNPFDPGEGGVFLDSGIAVPLDARLSVNGAPIVEQSREIIVKKKPKKC